MIVGRCNFASAYAPSLAALAHGHAEQSGLSIYAEAASLRKKLAEAEAECARLRTIAANLREQLAPRDEPSEWLKHRLELEKQHFASAPVQGLTIDGG